MTKEISVDLISSSVIRPEAALRWIKEELGFSDYELPEIGKDGVTAAGLVIMCCAKRCYNAFDITKNPNLTRVRKDLAPYIENILSSGHGSVLEHVTFTFAIENITRVLTAELNRHRAGVSISEGSMRYIRFDSGIPYWLPLSIRINENDDSTMINKKLMTQKIFLDHFEDTKRRYDELLNVWSSDLESNFSLKKKLTSMFRRIIPLGVQTGGTWTFNVRSLRHILALRGTQHAEEEIDCLAKILLSIMKYEEPLLFCDMEIENEEIVCKYPKV